VQFGSSGIRGLLTEVTPDIAVRLGLALGATHASVVVGRDARTSSIMLEEALVAGLLSAGASVARAGLAPTPALAYATRDGFACGVAITASHNPPEYNGFKPWNPDGSAFDAAQRADVEKRMAAADPPRPDWRGVGASRVYEDATGRHARAIVERLGTLPRPLRVVVDCGNGAASLESPLLMRALGASVVTLNAQPDGTFPGRPSEPSAENLRALSEVVRQTGADLGLAHDGDADRLAAVDERGRAVAGDALVALFARASGARRVAVPVDTSLLVDDALPGVAIDRTRVGDAYVSETLRRTGGGWGGEASGAFIFPDFSLCPDGPLAAATLAHKVAREGPLSKLVDALPRYPIARGSHPVPNERKAAVLAGVARRLAGEGRVSTLDGVRVDLPEGWILVRASGTEPKVRWTAEARRPEDLERLKTRAEGALKAEVS